MTCETTDSPFKYTYLILYIMSYALPNIRLDISDLLSNLGISTRIQSVRRETFSGIYWQKWNKHFCSLTGSNHSYPVGGLHIKSIQLSKLNTEPLLWLHTVTTPPVFLSREMLNLRVQHARKQS